MQRASQHSEGSLDELAGLELGGEQPCLRVVLIDGQLQRSLSSPLNAIEGVYVGSLDQAPSEAVAELVSLCHSPAACLRLAVLQQGCMQGAQSHVRGSPFALVNGATAGDALCIVVQAGVQAPAALHLLYLSTGGAWTACCPLAS